MSSKKDDFIKPSTTVLNIDFESSSEAFRSSEDSEWDNNRIQKDNLRKEKKEREAHFKY